MSYARDLKLALGVAWELIRRRPLLASLPVFMVVRIAYPEHLERWVGEAYEAWERKQ